MTWGEFLKMLADDGVTLDRIEYDAITEDGDRHVRYMLSRSFEGRLLAYDLSYPRMDARVSRWTIRRIANTLRVPVDKYIKPY